MPPCGDRQSRSSLQRSPRSSLPWTLILLAVAAAGSYEANNSRNPLATHRQVILTVHARADLSAAYHSSFFLLLLHRQVLDAPFADHT